MSMDGFEWDAPDTPGNVRHWRSPGRDGPGAFPKVRVATVSECGSHAVADVEIGGIAGKGSGEQSLARKLCRRLEEDRLLIADRNFYNWEDWKAAAASEAQLLWRVKADLRLPVRRSCPMAPTAGPGQPQDQGQGAAGTDRCRPRRAGHR